MERLSVSSFLQFNLVWFNLATVVFIHFLVLKQLLLKCYKLFSLKMHIILHYLQSLCLISKHKGHKKEINSLNSP